MKNILSILAILLGLTACKQEPQVAPTKHPVKPAPVRVQPKTVTYHFAKTKTWLAATQDSAQIQLAFALNRTDKANLQKMDSILVASDMTGDVAYYLPFPLQVPYLSEVPKIIFFSYPTQTFAAYEYGELQRTGPTNMGRKTDPTPTGLFFTNWKAETSTSTFNDEWDLRWNFNIANKLGVGWHQYTLPGYPASHSCLRLGEADARYLYDWADQWIMKNDNIVLVQGTPVIIFGTYPFGEPKPWYQLANNPKALDLKAIDIQQETQPFLARILKAQQNRDAQKPNP